VIQQTGAHHAAPDDDDACVCFHGYRALEVVGHNKLIHWPPQLSILGPLALKY
jgi:hypothetical protein